MSTLEWPAQVNSGFFSVRGADVLDHFSWSLTLQLKHTSLRQLICEALARGLDVTFHWGTARSTQRGLHVQQLLLQSVNRVESVWSLLSDSSVLFFFLIRSCFPSYTAFPHTLAPQSDSGTTDSVSQHPVLALSC